MNAEQTRSGSLDAPWRFMGLFILYMGLSLTALRFTPFPLIESFVIQTTSGLTAFLKMLSLPVTSDGPMMYYSDFAMEITLECTAIYQLVIAISGIWAYPAHSAGYKATGTLVVSGGILLLNAARIGVLGAVGYYVKEIFEFMHIYLWQTLFALLTLLLWILWVQGGRVLSRVMLKYVVGSLAAASLFTLLLLQVLPLYAVLLAGAATLVSPLLSWMAPLPQAFMAQGSYVVFQFPGKSLSFVLSVYAMNTVLFATLLVVTATRSQMTAFFKRLAVGLMLLFVLHLGFVMEYALLLSHVDPEAAFNSFFWFDRGLSFAAPLLIWLLVMKLFAAPKDVAPDRLRGGEDRQESA